MDVHYIQKLILMDLAENKQLLFGNFIRIKDLGIEKDLLNYHLKTLIKDKRVSKEGKHYTITTEGKRYIANLDFDHKKAAKLPKVSIAVAITRTYKGKKRILLAKRMKAPFLDS